MDRTVDHPEVKVLKVMNNKALHDYAVLVSRGFIRHRAQVKTIDGHRVVGYFRDCHVSELLEYFNDGHYEYVQEITHSFADTDTILRRTEEFALKPGFDPRIFNCEEREKAAKKKIAQAGRARPRILQDEEGISDGEDVCGIPIPEGYRGTPHYRGN